MTTTLANGSTTKTCLNGHWDFLPVFDASSGTAVPQDGWIANQYVVPSMWNKSKEAIRQPGEKDFRVMKEGEALSEQTEFNWDAFGYPLAWDKTVTAWARRSITIQLKPGRRYFVEFEGILRRSTLFVNGKEVTKHFEGTLPLEADITEFLHEGDNEIAVFMEDYTRAARDRTIEPSGNMFTLAYCGIWQDVWLIERADVYVSDLTIRTSTRKKEIEVKLQITNASPHPRSITLAASTAPWKRKQKPDKVSAALTFPPTSLELQPNETRSLTLTQPWADAEYWQPERPSLYWLRTEMTEGKKLLERFHERFGFREVWIDGPHIMMNGFPIHMFSDWCHKLTPYHMTEAWIRQWFKMLKDSNMNHTRLHAFPHSKLHLDLADEEGILITDETALYGSSGRNACERPEYWERSRDHVRRLIKRDKNRPSVVLWSVENEFRWANEGPNTRYTPIELPNLKKLFNELDPTRPAYHEGDSSLWNERHQDILSRHYGKDCSGLGWWDRTQPLHSGELSFYHYLGPNNSVQNAGDRPWVDYADTDEAAGIDTALTVEEGRTVGVCSFGPWNISGMSNLRDQKEKITLSYDDLTTPGIKPITIQPYASEFKFWEKGRGYTPAPSFGLLKKAFRPLAVVDRSHGHSYFTGETVTRELFVVNDTAGDVTGTLTVTVGRGKNVAFTSSHQISVARGHVDSVKVAVQVPGEAGKYDYAVHFQTDVPAGFDDANPSNGEISDGGRRVVAAVLSDSWKHAWRVDEPVCRIPKHLPATGTLAVLGTGTLKAYLAELGIEPKYITDLSADSLRKIRILILEKNIVQPGTTLNKDLQAFVQRGGRAIVMEQHTSIFPAAPIEELPVLTAFIRAPGHAMLRGFEDADFSYWGEDPYALIDNDSAVAQRLYRKDDGRYMLPLLDAGEGAFGTGDLTRTPLLEVTEGTGLLIACQLRITDKLQLPIAGRLFARLLDRAISFKYSRSLPPHIESGADASAIERSIDKAGHGAVVLVQGIPADQLETWSKALGVALTPMDVGEVFQGIKTANDDLFTGISHEDLSGIQNWVYFNNPCIHITHTALSPVDGLDAILVTPTRSCLRELFHHEGKSETLRIPFVSRVLMGGVPGPAVLMGRVKVGQGTVIISQFTPARGTLPRLDRATNRLHANLGIRFDGSLFDGERIPDVTGNGPGYPRNMQLFNDTCDEARRAEFLKHTIPNPERFDSMPILQCGTWKRLEVEDGVVKAEGLDLGKDVYIYYSAVSPTQRKQPSMDLGIPNPDSYTFVDFIGTGSVELIVDGEVKGRETIRDGMATISDIPLEKGVNRVLVKWTPSATTDTLQMKWRNILRQPERQLQFWGWM